uniref:Uncharacterized protein n=1 Tax=Gopherus agassizii TaxID=38772 RepID=A0A452H0B3_9SAUR
PQIWGSVRPAHQTPGEEFSVVAQTPPCLVVHPRPLELFAARHAQVTEKRGRFPEGLSACRCQRHHWGVSAGREGGGQAPPPVGGDKIQVPGSPWKLSLQVGTEIGAGQLPPGLEACGSTLLFLSTPAVKLTALKSLDLSRCPHVDDWTLNRLHVFKDSLEELSLAGCPQVTERGLACLHQLEHLRRLDLSHLPSVPTPGLIRILVEEMLPRCEVVGLGPGDGLASVSGAQTSRDGREKPSVPSEDRRAGEIPA